MCLAFQYKYSVRKWRRIYKIEKKSVLISFFLTSCMHYLQTIKWDHFAWKCMHSCKHHQGKKHFHYPQNIPWAPFWGNAPSCPHPFPNIYWYSLPPKNRLALSSFIEMESCNIYVVFWHLHSNVSVFQFVTQVYLAFSSIRTLLWNTQTILITLTCNICNTQW